MKWSVICLVLVVAHNVASQRVRSTVTTLAAINKKTKSYGAKGRDFVALLRIPNAGATAFTSAVKVVSHGCSCDHSKCAAFGENDCAGQCAHLGCFQMWTHAPILDFLELHNTFVAARIPRKRVHFATILTEPFERMLEEYIWVLQKAPHACGGHRMLTKTEDESGRISEGVRFARDYYLNCSVNSFEEFARDPTVMSVVPNRQTKMLAGLAGFPQEEMYDSPEQMLEVAKLHLQTMPFFGLGNRLKDSARLLEKAAPYIGATLQIDQKELASNDQKHRVEHTVAAETKAAVLEINSLDVQLYDFAVGVFNRRMARMKPGKKPRVYDTKISTEEGATLARCVSGLCSRNPMDAYDVVLHRDTLQPGEVHFGESLESEFLRDRSECNFGLEQGEALGSYSWYNANGGCAHDFNWYHRNVYQIDNEEGSFFSTRALYSIPNLVAGGYVLAIGDADTMGVYARQAYLSHVEHRLRLPTVSVAYGKVGAGFFVDLLENRQSTLLSKTTEKLIRGARVVVVQTMRVEAERNSVCRTRCDTPVCERSSWKEMMASASDSERHSALQESRDLWLSNHQKLLSMASKKRERSMTRSVVLLHFETSDSAISQEMLSSLSAAVPKDSAEQELFGHFIHVRRDEKDPSIHINLELHQCTRIRTRFKRICKNRPKVTTTCELPSADIGCHCYSADVSPFATSRQHLMAGMKIVRKLMLEDASKTLVQVEVETADETLTPLQFFMMMTKGLVSTTSRTPAVSLETACKHHPGAEFYLYVPNNSSVVVELELLEGIAAAHCSIEKVPFDYEAFFIGSPLEGWMAVRHDGIKTGQHWYSHATDLFRTVTLWKYGGWYLDTDVLVLKPLSAFSNVVAWEGPNRPLLNNAVSAFDREHPVLEEIMHQIILSYDKNRWEVAGPGAITDVMMDWPRKNCDDHDCVTVLSHRTFFPIASYEPLFRPDVDDEAYAKAVDGAYCIHLWNKSTKRYKALKLSVFTREYTTNCIICSVPVEGV